MNQEDDNFYTWITEREKYLQTLTTNSIETGVKFLFTTNSGGAVSILTYLGAIAKNPNNFLILKTSLAFFFIGVLLIGIYHAYVAESYGKIFWDFNKLSKFYILGKIERDEYIKQVEQQAMKYKNHIARIIAYSSFLCFIIGASFGTIGIIT